MPRNKLIQPRLGTLAQWATAEASAAVLADGELGYITDTKDWVVGDGTTKVASLPRSGSSTYVHVGSTSVDAEAYGGDLSDAVAALPSGGGTVWLSRPTYTEAALSLAGRKGVHLRGAGSAFTEATTGTVPPTRVVMTTQGAGTAIDAQGAQSLKFTDLDVTYTSGFTGTLIDARGAADPNAMFMPSFQRCRIGGDYATSLRSAALLVDAGYTVEPTFRDVVFHDAVRAVKGIDATAGKFATEALFANCKFEGFTAAPILNPGTKWNFTDNTVFEPLFGGAAGAVECQVDADCLIFNGASCWDATAAGQWIDFRGVGLIVTGGSRFEVSTGVSVIRWNGACAGGGFDFSMVRGGAGSLCTYNSGATLANWRVGKSNHVDMSVAPGAFRKPVGTVGANAGAGAATPTIMGVDEAFSIGLSTGTSPTDGTLAHVAYKVPFTSPPSVVLAAENIDAANALAYHFYVANRAADGFDIAVHTGSTPPGSVTGGWLFTCVSVPAISTNA